MVAVTVAGAVNMGRDMRTHGGEGGLSLSLRNVCVCGNGIKVIYSSNLYTSVIRHHRFAEVYHSKL